MRSSSRAPTPDPPPTSFGLGASVRSPGSGGRSVDGPLDLALWNTELVAVDLPAVDPPTDRSLDGPQLALLRRRNEGQSVPGGTGSCGATDSVDVVLGLDRDIEVDHVRQRLDVDAS